MNLPVGFLQPFALLIVSILFSGSCERSEYTNRFTTPVASIGNNRIELENGRDVRIPGSQHSGTTVLVLVRNAEKDTGADPPLTERGQRRAKKLAEILQGMELDEIYSSPYIRNEQTAEPVADRQGLKISSYDPSRVEDFLDLIMVRNKGERMLIVGHVNTTPQLLNLLLGRQAYEQIEDEDYDNLFVASIEANGRTNILSLRFTVE